MHTLTLTYCVYLQIGLHGAIDKLGPSEITPNPHRDKPNLSSRTGNAS